MTDTDQAAVFHTWAKAVSDGDLGLFLPCFSQEAVIEDFALNSTTRGLDAIDRAAAAWFAAFRDADLELDLHLAGDGHAAVSWTYTAVVHGAHPGVFDDAAVGRRCVKHGVSVFRFDHDNRFAWERSYWDLGEFQRSIAA